MNTTALMNRRFKCSRSAFFPIGEKKARVKFGSQIRIAAFPGPGGPKTRLIAEIPLGEPVHLAFGIFAFNGVAFIVQFAATCQPDFNLGHAAIKIHL